MDTSEALGKSTRTAGQGAREPAATAAPEHATNNFDLLRLVFAGMVFAYHLAFLSGIAGWRPAAGALAMAAEIGVQGFFVLSGYLVYGSLKRSRSVWVYAEKRVRRLYPAYAAVVIVCALAALAASPEARADLAAVGRYLGWNLVFLNFMEPTLPGLFDGQVQTAVNGALWTIKIEVMFYAVLPLLAPLLAGGRWLRWGALAGLYVFAEAWRIGLIEMEARTGTDLYVDLALQLPGQLSFFLAGVAAHFLPASVFRKPLWSLVAVVGLAASILSPWAEPLRAASLGWLSIALALGLPRLVDAARFGDLSYGVYITHFPIIQALIAAGAFAAGPALAAGLTVGLVLLASLLLWTWVERPALRKDSAYRRE